MKKLQMRTSRQKLLEKFREFPLLIQEYNEIYNKIDYIQEVLPN